MILWNNEIKKFSPEIGCFFLKSWFEVGIFSIQDILIENEKFLSFQEFKQTYKIKCNFSNYYQVISDHVYCR